MHQSYGRNSLISKLLIIASCLALSTTVIAASPKPTKDTSKLGDYANWYALSFAGDLALDCTQLAASVMKSLDRNAPCKRLTWGTVASGSSQPDKERFFECRKDGPVIYVARRLSKCKIMGDWLQSQ